MPKKPLARIFPGNRDEEHVDSNLSQKEIVDGLNRVSADVEAKTLEWLKRVASFTTNESYEGEAQILISRGWKQVDYGWEKNGVRLASDEGFNLDREAHTLHAHARSMRALSNLLLKTPPGAMPTVYAAFLAGASYAEFQAYPLLTQGRGQKPIDGEVFAALSEAERQLLSKKPQKKYKAAELHLFYDKVRGNFGAPPLNSGTFNNWVSRWRKSSRI